MEDTVLTKLRCGDEKAFGKLVSDNYAMVLNQANKILNNRQDAEEVAQDTFIKARNSISNFRGDCALSTWLYRIATNLAKNKSWYWWRRKRHASVSFEEPVASDDGTSITFGDVIKCEMQTPSEANITNELEEFLPKAMAQMPEIYAQVLRLRNENDLSYEEIAEKLNIGVGTVKSRLSRAIDFLREKLNAEK